jgi:crotonobetainyl-CoA:carnitine CoA-transferase CaiB-like acyl-CoA transferase
LFTTGSPTFDLRAAVYFDLPVALGWVLYGARSDVFWAVSTALRPEMAGVASVGTGDSRALKLPTFDAWIATPGNEAVIDAVVELAAIYTVAAAAVVTLAGPESAHIRNRIDDLVSELGTRLASHGIQVDSFNQMAAQILDGVASPIDR